MSKKKVTRKSTINPTKSRIANNKDSNPDNRAKNEMTASQKGAKSKTLTAFDSGDMVFNKTTYTYILGGLGLMIIGFFLMAGGHNDDPNVFDEDVIYSTRRTLIAPIFILAGLVVQVLAIFKK